MHDADLVPGGQLRLHRRVHHGLRKPANWLQLLRFGAVGASGYVVNLAVFAAARALILVDEDLVEVFADDFGLADDVLVPPVAGGGVDDLGLLVRHLSDGVHQGD